MADYDGELKIRTQITADNLKSQLLTIENRIAKTGQKADELRAKLEAMGKTKVPTEDYKTLASVYSEAEKKANGLIDKMERMKDLAPEGTDVTQTKAWTGARRDLEMYRDSMREAQIDMKTMRENGTAFIDPKTTDSYKKTEQDLQNLTRQQEIYAQQAKVAQDKAALANEQAAERAQKAADKEAAATQKKEDAQIDAMMKEQEALRSKDVENIMANEQPAAGANESAARQGLINTTTLMKGLGQAGGIASGAIENMYGTLIKAGRGAIQSGIKGIGNAIGGLASRAKEAASSALSAVTSVGNGFTKFVKRIGNMAKRVFFFSLITKGLREIRSGITDGMGALAKYDDQFNATMSSFKTALAQLQGSFASAFAPIISAVIPYLQTLINWLTRATDAVGQFFSAITGKGTYTKLIANQQNYAASLDKTKKSAKQATQALAGFDELDVLNKNNGSGGGGSGSTPTFGGTEELPISKQMQDLADMLKNGQYFDFGNALADMIADQLEKIPWDKIRTRAYELGQHLAEILNGVFSNLRLATDLGITLAQGINTALDFLYGFITKFNWSQFGVWWGYFFNAFVQAMDWDLLGDTILAGINGVIAALYGFFNTIFLTMKTLGQQLGKQVQKVMTGINWRGMADTILMALTDITAAIQGWNESIDWVEIADSIENGVNELALGMVMDPNGTIHQVWAENGQAVGQAIGEFLSGLHEFVVNFPFAQFTQALSQWFQNAIAGINFEELGDTIHAFVTGIIDSIDTFLIDPTNRQSFMNAWKGFLEGLNFGDIMSSFIKLAWDFFNFLQDAFNEMSWGDILATFGPLILQGLLAGLIKAHPIVLAIAALGLLLFQCFDKMFNSDLGPKMLEFGEDLIQGLLNGITSIMTSIGTWIKEHIFDPFINFFKELFGIHSPSTVMEEMGQYLIEGLLQGILDLWNTITDFFAQAIPALVESIRLLFSQVVTVVQTIGETLRTVWNTIWTAIQTVTTTIWNGIKTTVTTVFTAVRDLITTILEAIKTVWTTVWTAVKSFGETIWNGIKATVEAVFNAIRGTISTILNGIRDNWSKVWTAIKDAVVKIWDGIKQGVTTAFQSVQTVITTVLNSISQTWRNVWTGMRDFLKGIINGIIGFVNGMIDAIEGALNFIIRGINSLSFDVPDWVPKIGGDRFGFHLNEVSMSHVPQLANGGIVERETLARIGEGGNREAVLPLERNTEWIDELADRLADTMSEAGTGGINSVTMEMNGTELARVFLDDLISEIQRRGLTVDTVFAAG